VAPTCVVKERQTVNVLRENGTQAVFFGAIERRFRSVRRYPEMSTKSGLSPFAVRHMALMLRGKPTAPA
jgi:hypothetical protein